MIEKLDVLQEAEDETTGAVSFTVRYSLGGLPLELEAAEESFGDTAKVDESQAVRIARTPATEQHVVPGSHVTWRGEPWTVRTRRERNARAQYDVLLERTR